MDFANAKLQQIFDICKNLCKKCSLITGFGLIRSLRLFT